MSSRIITRTWRAWQGLSALDFLTLDTSGSGAGATATTGGTGPDAYLELAPAVTTSAYALLTGPTLDLNAVESVSMSLIGCRFSHQTAIGLRLGAWDVGPATKGGFISIPAGTASGNNSPFARTVTFPTNSGSNPSPGDSKYVARYDNEWSKIRDLGVVMRPQAADKLMLLMEGDQAAVAWRHPQLALGTVTPALQVLMATSGSIAARYVRCAGIDLSIAYK